MRSALVTLASLLALAVPLAAQTTGPLELYWSSIDAGGTTSTSQDGSTYEVFGVIGQPDANVHSGFGFTLYGGFLNSDPGSAFAISDVSQLEGSGGLTTFTFTITRTGETSGEGSVEVSTVDGTATAPADYAGFSGQVVSFATGQSQATVNVEVVADTVVEGDETFRVVLSSPSDGAFLGDDTGVGTIRNDDSATVAIGDVVLAEGDTGTTSFSFTVTVTGAVQGGFTVPFSTSDGTAAAPGDYATTSGTLTFAGADGEMQVATVLVVGDLVVEPDEDFTVILGPPTHADVTAADDTGLGTILNDDSATLTISDVTQAEGDAGTTSFVFTVTLSEDVQGGFSVPVSTADDTATAPGDYADTSDTLTFSGTDGEMQSFTVPVVGDDVVESDETFTVTLGAASNPDVTAADGTGLGTILNDEATLAIGDVTQFEGDAGTTDFTFTVTLSGDLHGGFTVPVSTADGMAAAPGDYTPTSETLTFAGADGEVQTVTVPVVGDEVVEPDETFTVTLGAASSPDVSATDDTGLGTILNDDSADLTITKSDSADPVNAAAAFSYTLNVSNGGPSTATLLTVTDKLPAGVVYVSATGTGWSCNEIAGTVTCTRASLAVGAAPAITISVTAPAESGTLSNTATVATESDPASGNDSDTETTDVTAVADLSITKSDSADPVNAAAAFSYTLNVSNGGPSTATSVAVTDTLPAGVGFVSALGTGWSCNEVAGTVTCTRASLAVGAAPAITVNVTAPAAGGMISNTASVAAAENDPAAGNDSDAETTNVTAVADVSITKNDSADPVNASAAFGYTLNVSNGGPSTATSVTVTDTLPAGVAFVSASGTGWICNEVAGTVTCTLGGLAVGAAPAITINVTAPSAGGMLSNTASVDATENDPVAANDSDAETTNVTAVADLSVTKTAPPGIVIGGQPLVYTVTVSNAGPSTATSVTVTDTLPAGVAFVSASGSGWTCNEAAGTVTCTRPSLAVGAAPAITINVTVDSPPPASITNTASVAGTESDPNAANDEGSAMVVSDLVPPAVVSVTAVPGGSVSECVTVARRVQSLQVVFSKPMQDSGGLALEAGDADNPAGYLLVGTGANLDFETNVCGVLQGDDVAVPVASIAYAADTPAAPQSTATLTPGAALADGLYRFFACDAKDTGGNVLDDFTIDLFRVDAGNLFANGHFDCDAAGWSAVGAAVPVHDPVADADGSALSGALSYTAQGAMSGVEQCASLTGTVSPYDLSVRFRLDGVPASTFVQFLADCAFYGGAACSGTLLQAGTLSPLVVSGGTGGNWLLWTHELTPPAGAASAQCDAVASGPPALSFGLRLDRLRLQGSNVIFSDGFESGNTSAWSRTQN